MNLKDEMERRREAEWNERHEKFLHDAAKDCGLFEIDILFDGPPGPEAGRFIDCHDAVTGEGLRWGRWLDNGDGTWSLMGIAVRDPAVREET